MMRRLEEWKTFQITKQNPEYWAQMEISQIGDKKHKEQTSGSEDCFPSTIFTKEMTLKASVC